MTVATYTADPGYLRPRLRSRPSDGHGAVPEAVLFGSLSALLLLIAMVFPSLWLIAVVALVPLIYQITRSSPVMAAGTGAVFGCALFGVSQLDAVMAAPLWHLPLVAVGAFGGALFGWLTAWGSRRIGFNALDISLVWVGVELLLTSVGLMPVLDAGPLTQTSPLLCGLAAVCGTALVSFIIILVNAIVVAAIAAPKVLGGALEQRPDAGPFLLWTSRLITAVASLHCLQPDTRGPPSCSQLTALYCHFV